MRFALPALLAALLVLPILPAQSDVETASLLEDGPGDVTIVANGMSNAAPAGQFGPADLVSLAIEESRLDFVFRLTVADLKPDSEAPLMDSTNYELGFRHNDRQFLVYAYRSTLTETSYYAYLAVMEEGDPFGSTVAELPITFDIASSTMAITVGRDLLVDANGASPFPGRTLSGFHVRSASFIDSSNGGSVNLGVVTLPLPAFAITDTMPATGNGTVDWAVRFGLAQTGAMHLASSVPFRASNGEATTFLFEVEATNSGPTQTFTLETSGVPATWHVELPSDAIEILEEDVVRIPVLVSTPFAHEHGKLQSFVLEAKGTMGDDVGRVQLGVRYTQPPQPAGHHSTVYLHTAPARGEEALNSALGTAFGQEFKELYFNTQAPADDPNDRKIPVAGTLSEINPGPPPSIAYTWRIPLSPALEMGLDFDLAATGTIDLGVDSLLPMPGAVLTGRLVYTAPDADQSCGSDGCSIDDFYFGYGDHLTVAAIGPSAPVDVGPNAVGTSFSAAVLPLPAGDYLPFSPGGQLGMELNLTFTRVDTLIGPRDAPKLSGGEAVLPLAEYHDPVDQVFSSLAGLMIVVDGDAERLVNPGETLLFDLGLMNHGSEEASYDLELTGSNAGWAFIVGDTHVTVPVGETRQLGIAVTAPAGASDGDLADLVFAAVDAKDPTARTLARLVAVVDTDADQPDDAARVPGLQDRLSSKDSPGLGAGLALAGLAAVAVALRRRRA
jgi:mannose-6-phosphate isomerase-like protein (cupin superfamily)